MFSEEKNSRAQSKQNWRKWGSECSFLTAR